MTTPPTAGEEIDRSAIGQLGGVLGKGGQAKVHDAPGLRLPDVAGPLVYKEYLPGAAPAHGPRRLVALRNAADPALRARLDALTAWPSRQVVERGAVVGLVMPRIHDDFFQEMRLPSGKLARKPREVQFLLIPPDKAQLLDLPVPSPQQRLALCRDFAAALAFLHDDLDVVFGDINACNALFRLDTEPMVMFVDCDAARRTGDMAAVAQLNAPDWELPGSTVLSKDTDLYKLGLFILRCLTPGNLSSVNRDPARARLVLDAQGMALLKAAVGGPAGQRPTAQQWVRYLRRCLGEATTPPVLTTATIGRSIVAAGEPVVLTWAADEADEIEISGVGLAAVVVDGGSGGGDVEVRPTRTGTLHVVARNALGEDAITTPPVAVFDVAPRVSVPVAIPHLDLPQLDRTPLPAIGRALPSMPHSALPELPAHATAVGQWPTDPAPGPAVGPSSYGSAPLASWPYESTPDADVPVDITSIFTSLGWDDAPATTGATP